MQQHIRIAMPDGMAVMRDLDAADSKRATPCEAVRIVANANPLVRRLSSLSFIVSTAVTWHFQIARQP